MIKHFAADGSVKQAWSDAVCASAIVREGKTLQQVQGSNFVLAEIELAEGEQIGEQFIAPAAPAVEITREQAVELFGDDARTATLTAGETILHAGITYKIVQPIAPAVQPGVPAVEQPTSTPIAQEHPAAPEPVVAQSEPAAPAASAPAIEAPSPEPAAPATQS